MADYDYDPAFKGFLPGQVPGGFWVNMLVNRGLDINSSSPVYRPGIGSPYTTLQDRFSAYADYRRYTELQQGMSAIDKERDRKILIDTLELAAKTSMKKGDQQFTQAHRDAIIGGYEFMKNIGSQLTGSGKEMRQLMDLVAGGASRENVGLALELDYKSAYDPISGDNLSAKSRNIMAEEIYKSIWGDGDLPDLVKAKGLSAHQLVPIRRHMTRFGLFNEQLEKQVLLEGNYIQQLRSTTATDAEKQSLRKHLVTLGLDDQVLTEISDPTGEASTQAGLERVLLKSTGRRFAEAAKQLNSLKNVFKDLADPNSVQSMSEMYESMERFSAVYGQQFSAKDSTRLLRQSFASLKDIGLSTAGATALMEQHAQIRAQMGFQGGLEFAMNPLSSASLAAFVKGEQVQAYGAWNRSQMDAKQFESIASAAGSSANLFNQALIFSVDEELDLTNTAEGDRVRNIIKNLRDQKPTGDVEYDMATTYERQAILSRALKESEQTKIGKVADAMANKDLMETMSGLRPGMVGNINLEDQPEERRREFAKLAATKMRTQDLGGNDAYTEARATVEAFARMSKAEAAVAPDIVKTNIARRRLAVMTDAERLKYGATEKEQMRVLSAQAGDFLLGITGYGVNLSNAQTFLSYDQQENTRIEKTIADVKANIKEQTEGFEINNGLDAAMRFVNTLGKKLDEKQLESLDIPEFKELLIASGSSAIGALNEKDEIGLQLTYNAVTKLNDLRNTAIKQKDAATEGSAAWNDGARRVKLYNNALKSLGSMLNDVSSGEPATSTEATSTATSQDKEVSFSGTPVFNNLILQIDGASISVDQVKAQPTAAKGTF